MQRQQRCSRALWLISGRLVGRRRVRWSPERWLVSDSLVGLRRSWLVSARFGHELRSIGSHGSGASSTGAHGNPVRAWATAAASAAERGQALHPRITSPQYTATAPQRRTPPHLHPHNGTNTYGSTMLPAQSPRVTSTPAQDYYQHSIVAHYHCEVGNCITIFRSRSIYFLTNPW